MGRIFSQSRFLKWAIFLSLTSFFFLLGSARVPAEEQENLIRFQGVIMENRMGILIINEEEILITAETSVWTSEATPASLKELIPGRWVFLEAMEMGHALVARKIYLIPGRIKNEDMLRYPFMQEPE